jgi:hypothetical protein
MFAPLVYGRYQIEIRRGTELPVSWTTCEQAEALYPEQLSLEYLKKIYVSDGCDQDDVYGQLAAIGWRSIGVEVAPERFFGHMGV